MSNSFIKTAPIAVLIACGSTACFPREDSAREPAIKETKLFRCDGNLAIRVDYLDDNRSARLRLAHHLRTLDMSSYDGLTFRGSGYELWSSGEEITLRKDGGPDRACRKAV